MQKLINLISRPLVLQAIIVVALVFSGFGAVQMFNRQAIGKPTLPINPVAFQGVTKLPESEFKPVLESGQQELEARHKVISKFQFWCWTVSIASVGVSIILALVCGYLGRSTSVSQSGQMETGADSAVGHSSTKVVRIIGVLVALITSLGLVKSNLEAEQSRRISAAEALNTLILDTTAFIYDPAVGEMQARTSLTKLQLAMKKTW